MPSFTFLSTKSKQILTTSVRCYCSREKVVFQARKRVWPTLKLKGILRVCYLAVDGARCWNLILITCNALWYFFEVRWEVPFSFRKKKFSGTSHVNLLDGQSSCEFAGRSLVVLPIKIDILAM